MKQQLTDEQMRLIAFSEISHARLDALQWMTVEELTEIQREAEAMTPEEIEAMLIELKRDELAA